jgi:peptide/nickel transport system permease protein
MLGTVMGFLAAHFRGLVDDAIMVMSDIQAALPFFMIALVAIAILGPSVPLFVLLLGLFGWERYARLARAMALSANEHGYAEALRGLGVGPLRIYWRHILPNIASVLIVNATLSFSETLLLESTLSFLGLGIQPPLTSLGNMVGFGREIILSAWWVVASPALVILFCSLALAIVGDRLRDYLDPELT